MKKLLSVGGLFLVLGLFLAANLLFNTLLRSSRMDLTENKLYTLSSGTKSVVSKLNEPVKLKYYFSKKLAGEAGALLGYSDRVRELLEEVASHSNGNVTLEVYDPEPFSEEEDRAVGYGLQGVPVNAGGEKLYFGLAGTGTLDQEEVIPFFQQSQEESLEYDITKLVYNLSNPKKRVIGMITKLPVEGDMMERMRNPRAEPEEWFILEQIRGQFELRTIGDGVDKIEDGIDVLLVIHPQQLSQETLFAIDQYTLGGGKVLAFVDPHCEVQEVREDPQNPMQSMMADRSSTLGPLFDAWGIQMKADELAADRATALRVNNGGQPIEYLVWMGLRHDKGNFSTADFVTSQLETVNIASSGILSKAENGTTEITPLIETTRESQRIQKTMIQFGPDPARLIQSYKSGEEKLMLAARISGAVKTAFPNGNPKPAEPPADGAAPAPVPEPLKESRGPINVIVVADADLLANRFWTSVQNIFGRRIASPTASNCTFMMNALDNLSGSNDLISLRSRGKYQRPFEVVAEIRKDAETKFHQREKELEDTLRDTESRINELQRGKEGAQQFVLTPEQQVELEKFRDEQLKTRKELRRVKHDLLAEVESLGSKLKWLNCLLMPAAVAAFAALFLGARSANRKKS